MGVLSKSKEDPFDKKAYFNYLHNSDQRCIICNSSNIELHHITDLKNIKGARRDDKRLVILCKNHHKESKFGIHIMSKEEFYTEVMDFDTLMYHSNRLYQEYLKETKWEQY